MAYIYTHIEIRVGLRARKQQRPYGRPVPCGWFASYDWSGSRLGWSHGAKRLLFTLPAYHVVHLQLRMICGAQVSWGTIWETGNGATTLWVVFTKICSFVLSTALLWMYLIWESWSRIYMFLMFLPILVQDYLSVRHKTPNRHRARPESYNFKIFPTSKITVQRYEDIWYMKSHVP